MPLRVLLLATLAVASLAASADAAGTEQSFSGLVSGPPALGVAADGQAVAAWSTGSAVQAGIRPAGKSFGKAVRLSTGGPASRTFALGVGRGGAAVVVWQRVTSRGALTGSLQASIRRPGGTFRAPVTVPGSAGGRTPAAAVGPDGTLLVTWRTIGGRSGCGAFVEATTARPGGSFASARRISPSCANAREVRAALSADRTGGVVWQTGRAADKYGIAAAPLIGRSFGTHRALLAAPIVGVSAHVTGADSGVVVVWRQRATATRNGARGPVWLARLSRYGRWGVAGVSVSDRIVGVPRVAGRPDGSVLISWEQGGLRPEVTVAAQASSSARVTTPTVADACGATDASRVYPVPAVGRDSGAVVFQSSCMNRFGLGTDYGIAAARQSGTAAWQPAFGVSRGGYVGGVDAGASDGGELIIAWDGGGLRVAVIGA